MKQILILIFFILGTNVTSKNVDIDDHFIETDSTVYIYLDVDKLPSFNYEGMNAIEYIYNNLTFKPLLMGMDGTFPIVLSLIIKIDGNIDNIQIEHGMCDECNEDVIRTMKSMPKWVAGKKKGKDVNVKIYLPLKYGIHGY